MLQLPTQTAAKARPPKAVDETATRDFEKEVFGAVPPDFDLSRQLIAMLSFWHSKAIDIIHQVNADDQTLTDEDANQAVTIEHRIYKAMFEARITRAGDIASILNAAVARADAHGTKETTEVLSMKDVRSLAEKLTVATAPVVPTKFVGPLTRGRKLTRTGLLYRYHAFLAGEIETLSWNLYGSRDYAKFMVPYEHAVTVRVSAGFKDGKYNPRNRKSQPFFDESKLSKRARSVLKSLKIDAERDDERPRLPKSQRVSYGDAAKTVRGAR
jgi:hypothetical protein